jgi:hypothetical protein
MPNFIVKGLETVAPLVGAMKNNFLSSLEYGPSLLISGEARENKTITKKDLMYLIIR